MNYPSSFHDNQPIWWVRRMPVYLTSLIVAGFVLGMIICTVLLSANISVFPLQFYVGSFWLRHWFWEPITCVFVDSPSFFFVIGMIFYYQSAVEVEKFIGRKRYLVLFAILLLIPPIEQTIVWKTLGAGSLEEYFGSYHLMVGMFIAFATLYPNLEWFGWIPLKCLAFLGLFLVVLSCLPHHQWMNLVMHLSMCAASFGCIRYYQTGGFDFSGFKRYFQKKPKFRVVPSSPSILTRELKMMDTDEIESINPLLDKIAKSGIDSLTAKERAKLEKAREDLIKKDRR